MFHIQKAVFQGINTVFRPIMHMFGKIDLVLALHLHTYSPDVNQ